MMTRRWPALRLPALAPADTDDILLSPSPWLANDIKVFARVSAPRVTERLHAFALSEESAMTEAHPLDAAFAAKARIDQPTYERLYAESVRDPEAFWRRIGKRLDWITPYSKVRDVSFDAADLHIRWFHDGVLNVSANCLDRHLARHGDKTAIIWEGDDPGASRR